MKVPVLIVAIDPGTRFNGVIVSGPGIEFKTLIRFSKTSQVQKYDDFVAKTLSTRGGRKLLEIIQNFDKNGKVLLIIERINRGRIGSSNPNSRELYRITRYWVKFIQRFILSETKYLTPPIWQARFFGENAGSNYFGDSSLKVGLDYGVYNEHLLDALCMMLYEQKLRDTG